MSCEYRRKSDALLRQAADAADLNERSRLIDEAIYWHNLATTGPAAEPLTRDTVQAALANLEGNDCD